MHSSNGHHSQGLGRTGTRQPCDHTHRYATTFKSRGIGAKTICFKHLQEFVTVASDQKGKRVPVSRKGWPSPQSHARKTSAGGPSLVLDSWTALGCRLV